MADDDVLAALDLGVPPMRPAFRSDLASLIEHGGAGRGALDPPVIEVVDDDRPRSRRRRWLLPTVAAAAVVAILGTWVLVTAPEDQEPVASVPDLTASTETPQTSATSTPDTSPATAGERPASCLGRPVLTLTSGGVDAGEPVQTMEMVTESFGVTRPLDCRLISESGGDTPGPTAATTLVTAASSLILDGFPEDGGADGSRLRVLYSIYRFDPNTGAFEVLADGPLTVRSTTPFGYSTPSDPTLPPTPASFEVPLPDAPCMMLFVLWSLSDAASGRHVAYVGESPNACLPAP